MIKLSLRQCLLYLLTGLAVWSSASYAELVFVKQNSSPKYFDINSGQVGLCDEIYIELQTRLAEEGIEVRIDPVLYPVKRILALLQTGKAQVFCGAGRNKEREAIYIYSRQPVYSVSNVIMMHQDDNYVAEDYETLQKAELSIGAYYGTSSSKHLKSFEGVRVLDHFQSLDDAMTAVAIKRVDYFYYHDLGLSYLVSTSDLPLKLMPTKFRTIPQWMLYSPSISPESRDALERNFETMVQDGNLEKIHKKYLP